MLAVGGPAGEAYSPLPWEDVYVALAYQRLGQEERGRTVIRQMLDAHPGWREHYQASCFEAIAGNDDTALEYLRRAAELNRETVREYAATDADFDGLRADPRFEEALA